MQATVNVAFYRVDTSASKRNAKNLDAITIAKGRLYFWNSISPVDDWSAHPKPVTI